jgi:phosphatidylglycerol:prolipoprotein diacylglycerol transferase
MAVAKVACLCHGCCHGKPTRLPWAITYPDGAGAAPAGVPVHPTQAYELLVLAVAALILARVNRPFWRGTLIFWFLAIYGLGRVAVEFSRGDFKPESFLGPLTHSQWFCVAASAASIVVLAVYRRKHAARRGIAETADPSLCSRE